MKPFSLLALAALAATSVFAQMSQPMVDENTTKISEHVWAIMGFPNIAIVVGSHATLVVDTGLGPKNGATAAHVAAKLAPNNPKLFLTTTHFHPEHAAGEPGFPPGTILIRDAVQQQEMEKHGREPEVVRITTGCPTIRELSRGGSNRIPTAAISLRALTLL
jgi:glyoxylase-like metal-dependent hydrolase (beta-lactamase superfamily II)